MKYVDLFAGCGGLSLGFERAGFELLLAVEKSEMATETLSHNLIKPVKSADEWRNYVRNSTLKEQFKNKIITKELRQLLDSEILMQKLISAKIDVVVGGPPCQGFSMAGRRNPNDARNALPWQFLEFVQRTSPRAVVIENVVGMSKDFKNDKAPFKELQEALRTTGRGYVVQPVHVNAMHFGVPEHRPRLMILGIRKDIAKRKKIKDNYTLWHSDFSDVVKNIPDLAPLPTLTKKDIRTIKDALADLVQIPESQWSKSGKIFLKEMKNAKIWKLRPLKSTVFLNNSKRNHQPHAQRRFELYQYLRDQNLTGKVLNIPAIYDEKTATVKLKSLLKDCLVPARLSTGKVIAKDRSKLIKLIIELKTKKHSQKPLHWNKPAPTVVTLPDDYVHPDEPRIFTVRELARFQSFPDAFEFRSKETTGSDRRRIEVPQYSQVGNAVAPLLAYAVAKRFYSILTENHETADASRAKKS